MSDYQAVTAVTVSGAIVFGMVLSLLGTIKLGLARQFDLSGRRVSGLLATLNLTLIPMTILGGYLVDRWSPRSVLLLGSLVTTTALFAMSYAPTYRRAAVRGRCWLASAPRRSARRRSSSCRTLSSLRSGRSRR